MKISQTRIFLDNMHFHASHGVLPQETVVGGDFTVSVTIDYDFSKAVETDDISDTISYADVFDIVKREMAVSSKLIEHVAGRIAKTLLETYPNITTINVKLAKDNPPMGADCDGAGVEISYTNE